MVGIRSSEFVASAEPAVTEDAEWSTLAPVSASLEPAARLAVSETGGGKRELEGVGGGDGRCVVGSARGGAGDRRRVHLDRPGSTWRPRRPWVVANSWSSLAVGRRAGSRSVADVISSCKPWYRFSSTIGGLLVIWWTRATPVPVWGADAQPRSHGPARQRRRRRTERWPSSSRTARAPCTSACRRAGCSGGRCRWRSDPWSTRSRPASSCPRRRGRCPA